MLGDSNFLRAFIASLSVIVVSELGDKTFFIAAIMAMRHPRMIVFVGAITALALMTILSGKFCCFHSFSFLFFSFFVRSMCAHSITPAHLFYQSIWTIWIFIADRNESSESKRQKLFYRKNRALNFNWTELNWIDDMIHFVCLLNARFLFLNSCFRSIGKFDTTCLYLLYFNGTVCYIRFENASWRLVYVTEWRTRRIGRGAIRFEKAWRWGNDWSNFKLIKSTKKLLFMPIF